MLPEKRTLLLGEADQVIGTDIGELQKNIPPRFLRRAIRRAETLGLNAKDGYDALDQLMQQGIDILANDWKPTNKEIISPSPEDPMSNPKILIDPEERLREIARIQAALVARRRRRLAILMVKLAFFVGLPTFLAGWYYYQIATPMYETHSEFVIQKADPAAASTGLSGLLSGTALATSQDSIVVQGYLTSREAMQRLDKDLGFRRHFSAPEIDVLQRLAPDASDEAAYDLYTNKVIVGFDPSEGILRMSVIAASAEASQLFANSLVGYAEERVDKISQRAREDHMQGAKENYDDSETALFKAQQRLVELQQARGVLSSDVEFTSQMAIINSMELDLENKKLEREEILSNPRPNPTRIELNQAEIDRLQSRIGILRAQLTDNSTTSTSLAKIAGELRFAETEVGTRQLLLQQSVAQVETARMEANRQVRYLAMGVTPVAPDVPTLPRAFENTALAFIIFAGLYLLVSLTVSILREQVSV